MSNEELLSKLRKEVEWYFVLKPSRLMQIYIAVVSIVNIAVSLLLLIIMTNPIIYYRGFLINGYIEFINYDLTIAGLKAQYPVLDSMNLISKLTMVFALITLVLSILSFYGTRVMYRTWIGLIPIVSGSNALIIMLTYSIIRTFVYEIIPSIPLTIQINRYTGLLKVYQPETTYTWVYYLPNSSFIFLTIASILLFFTITILIYMLFKPEPLIKIKRKIQLERNRELIRNRKILLIKIIFFTAILAVNIFASSYIYRYSEVDVNIATPIVWFEDPGYPGVFVQLHSNKSVASVEITNFTTKIRLINRTGYSYDLRNETIVYTYFTPFTEQGCEYYVVEDGAGIVVTGNPAGGLYRGCGLRHIGSIRAGNISAVFVMKTNDVTPIDGIRGVILMESSTRYYYLAGIKNNATGWFFGIYEYRGRTVREPGGPVLPVIVDKAVPVISGKWVSISFTAVYKNNIVYMKASLYDLATGALISIVEKQIINPIVVDTFGIGVYQIRNKPSALFQMIGFTTANRVVIIRGLKQCCHVYVYDSSNNIIGEKHVYGNESVAIDLTNSAVVNAILKIICNNKEYYTEIDTLLGGDTYEVYLLFEGFVLEIHSYVNTVFEGWINLLNISCVGKIYCIEISLFNRTNTSSVNVTIIQYNDSILVLNPETNVLVFKTLDTTKAGSIFIKIESYIGTNCLFTILFNYRFSESSIGSLIATISFST